jgi:hypothetical protein
MPIDALLLSLAVCGVFLIFAAVLAWIDYRTTHWQRSRASEKHTVSATGSHRKKAA